MKNAGAQQADANDIGESRNPFGAAALRADTERATTLPDAVRRGRWIAVDLNATSFSLFFAGPFANRSLLMPCLDSGYPGIEAETRAMAGEETLGVVRHVRSSAVPFWWNDGPDCTSSHDFAALTWCMQIEPLAAGTCGIGFPVQADRGQCGLVVFFGREIALAPDMLYDIHARCFALFDAVARIRPADGGRLPAISRRELECLKLTANGYTSEEIAKLLKLSVHTANQYLTSTAQKLNAVNRMHAVAKALRLGFIE